MDGNLKFLFIFVILLTMIFGLVIQAMGSGIGISGPDQSFQIKRGENISSSITVWNEGEDIEYFSVSVSGNVSQITYVSPINFALNPEAKQILNLEYSAHMIGASGVYLGEIQICVNGTGIAPAASRRINIVVEGNEGSSYHIREGINLIAWLGANRDFDELFCSDYGISRIWKRKDDGKYTSVQYYSDTGKWWGPDESFVGLEPGNAYFLESNKDFNLNVDAGSFPSSLILEPGLNLVGWVYESKTFGDAFPQTPSNCLITKVWKREADGGYIFAEYYPEGDLWWSSDQNFTHVERGSAYFVEAKEELEVLP